ncbi:hypothetical protein AB1046_09490 [Promicromonospora sp. Populi]|uniref:AbiTii domain-containing protein n=1 Tax=Promicromonospora sp. Populi TaxID=3239420 RepID=UPI0034E30041
MTTALETAIDALSEPAVALPDALRRLLVVSRRIGADELTEWLRSELGGYPTASDVPAYRDGSHLPIKIRFDGPMGTSDTHSLRRFELPAKLSKRMPSLALRAPVAELHALASGDGDPQIPLPITWVTEYRRLADARQAPYMEMMTANYAAIHTPRTHLLGILDRVKSTALDLALSLEDVSPNVGGAGGPTVEDEPRLGQEIHLHLTRVYANNSSVAIGGDATTVSGDGVTLTSGDHATVAAGEDVALAGDHATVASGKGSVAIHIEQGDVESLLREAEAFLQSGQVEELSEALQTDGGQPGTATRGFLQRVKSGAYALAGGVGTNAAYDGLVELIQQAFPGFL